jgi:pyruvate dehydrogenase E2 component (dihydrolipoamide acetyltransferase)
LPFEQITGTGPNGRIIRRDVEAAIADRDLVRQSADSSGEPEVSRVAPRSSEPSTRARAEPEYADQPHSRLRRAIAARLTESQQTAPHFYLRGTARVDRLLKLRAKLNDGATTRISVNDLVIKAVAQAHLQVPEMNVSWHPDFLRSYSTIDLSVAIATDRGLLTPVLRSVETMSISSVARAVQDFAARAKAGRLQQQELEGGVATVTNLGMFGTEDFVAIINPPQTAILAVGAARQEAIVRKGKLKVGAVVRVTLSVDHRPVDGAVAAEWMRVFLSIVEHPLQILP